MRAILEDLSNELNKLNNNIELKKINQNAKEISQRYRANKNDGKRLLTESDEAISYALSRMPATYEAVFSALSKALEINNYNISTVLDIGAGTGTATWAVFQALGSKDFTCLEREDAMIKIGKKLMQNHEILKNVAWKKIDITKDEFDIKADLVIVSYMINEISKGAIDTIIQKVWNATNKVLLVIEPGTPHGFSNIKYIRNSIIKKEGYIIAPCAGENECPLPDEDWCSFSCRVQRSKTHKKLKDGTSSFEDEKFSYIAFSKERANHVENRILRHPIINKGYAEFKICTVNGIQNIKLSKKDGEIYKIAKKQNSGDSLKLK